MGPSAINDTIFTITNETILRCMDKLFTRIHHQIHYNHNKARHDTAACILYELHNTKGKASLLAPF